MLLFIAQAVERSLDLYIRTFAKDETDKLLKLSEIAQGTLYSTKYLNLLARTGKIFAVKRGRLWYTTKEAIDEYRKNRLRKK